MASQRLIIGGIPGGGSFTGDLWSYAGAPGPTLIEAGLTFAEAGTNSGSFANTRTGSLTGAHYVIDQNQTRHHFYLANASADFWGQNLVSNATIQTATDVEADTADIQTRIPDALSGGNMKVDVLAISGDATAADNAESFFDGTGYAGTNNTIPTVTNTTQLNGAATVVLTDASLTTAKLGAFALAKSTNITGFNDLSAAQVNTEADAALADAGVTTIRMTYVDNLNVGGPVASSSEVTGLNINTRANVMVPIEIETPDASTQAYKIRLFLFDETGNMEAPDSTPTIALVNAAGTDRSSRLSVASNPSTGVYSWDYTATAGDAEEQLIWTFTVVEAGLTRTYPATSYVVEETAYRFSSSDRANLNAVLADTNELQTDWTDGGRLDLILDSRAAQASVNTISTNVTLVKAQTDQLPTRFNTVDAANTAILADTNELQVDWTNGGRLDLLIDDIKAKTDTIPASPAAVGSEMTLTAAYDAAKTAATQASVNALGSPMQAGTQVVLSSAGLDQIAVTAPAGVASTFREMVVQTWRRFFKKATKTSTEIKCYADNGTTVLTTQAISDTAGVETQGTAT